jgi:cytochrome d ubiquinol oxidase subunit I
LIGGRTDRVRVYMKTAIVCAALLIPVQILIGDFHGLNTKEYQPAKVAAMEGNWETGTGVPLILFAIPAEQARENNFEIGIPKLASFILTHDWNGKVQGLNDFVTDDGEVLHPRVIPVFWSFRVMVGTGLLMLLVSWSATYMIMRRKRGIEGLPKPMLYALVGMSFSGWVATLAGWYTTEIGRQPWLVQGVMTTKEAVADVPAPLVLGTLIAYLVVYAALLAAYIFVIFYLARKAAKGEEIGTRVAPTPVRAPQAMPAE